MQYRLPYCVVGAEPPLNSSLPLGNLIERPFPTGPPALARKPEQPTAKSKIFDKKEGEYFIGRTEFDSPEVDNEVLVKAEKDFVRVGDFANVKIISAEDYDLYGEVV